MLNVPAERTQPDGQQDVYSADATIDCSDLPDTTRQEFAQEADINLMLSKFGVMHGQARVPQYTETDYSLDLQTALSTIADAKRAHSTLPDDVKKRYPTWIEFHAAVENGDYQKNVKPDDKAVTDSPVTPPPNG